MNRTRILMTSGNIIVKGAASDVGDRMRGSFTPWMEFQQVTFHAGKNDWIYRTVIINRKHVVSLTEVD